MSKEVETDGGRHPDYIVPTKCCAMWFSRDQRYLPVDNEYGNRVISGAEMKQN